MVTPVTESRIASNYLIRVVCCPYGYHTEFHAFVNRICMHNDYIFKFFTFLFIILLKFLYYSVIISVNFQAEIFVFRNIKQKKER